VLEFMNDWMRIRDDGLSFVRRFVRLLCAKIS
jgi:hypothetical protein